MNSNLVENLIKALEALQSQATTNPADISGVLCEWMFAECMEPTAISNHSEIGYRLYDDMRTICTEHPATRINNGITYYTFVDAPYLVALDALSISFDCTDISRVALLNCIISCWNDLKGIKETYDMLIALAETLKYYEEQIPQYENIIAELTCLSK